MGKLRIVSYAGERFLDRRQAGQQLAGELDEFRGQNAVVLGVPRGGVVVAWEVAGALDADLDVVLARKLRTPGHAELAMGAVAEDGKVFLNDSVVQDLGVSPDFIEREKETQMAEIARRSELIRSVWPRVPVEGRIAIVTDDGVATGATTLAALWAVRHERPQKLIAAIPVGSEDTIRRLAQEVDEMVCLRTPPYFLAVGQFYVHFEAVEDEDVLAILREEKERRAQRPAGRA